MKYCIFVLAHKNNLLLEKVLYHLKKYSTPAIPKYIILNSPSLDVIQTAQKFKGDFELFFFTQKNDAGLAIDSFIQKNRYDFYFKVDDDMIVSTQYWDKRLYITSKSIEKLGFISCMIPINCFNWVEAIKILNVEEEYYRLFPYPLENNKNSELYKLTCDIFEKLYKTHAVHDIKLNDLENSVYFSSPVWLDSQIAFWLWKKILELKLKPVNKLRRCYERYSISLIGFERRIWESFKTFSPDDEVIINNYCLNKDLKIITDYSVVAHHFSYRLHFDFLKENLFPIIKDIEF